MKPISVLTICGIEELPGHEAREVTHVLSLLDPDWPEIDAFQRYGAHHRRIFHFHDIIEPVPGRIAPTPDDMAAILGFGAELEAAGGDRDGHLLVHCHMGVSRSTAAMLTLLAQAYPDESEDRLFARLREIRPQAWPNSLMVGYADEQLGRGGRLTAALRRHYGHRLRHEPEVADWMTRLGRAREVEMAVG
jgi:predicted protein tyrosine phosphatase